MRWGIGLLPVALLVAACGGTVEVTTTSTTVAALSAEEEMFIAALAGDGGVSVERDGAIMLGHQVCRSLLVLRAAGVQGGGAADALREIDLEDATPEEVSTYGRVMAAASQTLCPDASFYAADVAYWLGT